MNENIPDISQIGGSETGFMAAPGVSPNGIMGPNYDYQPLDPFFSGFLFAILICLCILLGYNAYYLRRQKKAGVSIANSIIWTNVLFAVFTIVLAVCVYTAFDELFMRSESRDMNPFMQAT